MRLKDALDRFVVQLEADGRSTHTIDQYRRHVALLGRWLAQEGHGSDVDELTHETLARFLAAPDARTSRRGGPKKPTSMNALRSSMRAFFGYVHAAGWSRENPARLVRRARCSGPPPRGLSDQDRELLLSTLATARGEAAERDRALIHVLLGTGIRLSSALALKDSDIDLARGELILRVVKGQRSELVVLGSRVRAYLGKYLSGRGQPGPLFTGRAGRPVSRRHAARRLALWMRRAGCRESAHPHLLRSDFAIRLQGRCRDILVVQRALHHRSLTSTLRYVACSDDMLRNALKA